VFVGGVGYGVYTTETIRAMERWTSILNSARAIPVAMAKEVPTEYVNNESLDTAELFPEASPLLGKLWEYVIYYGSLASSFFGVYLLGQGVLWVVGTVLRLMAVKKKHGVGRKLFMALVPPSIMVHFSGEEWAPAGQVACRGYVQRSSPEAEHMMPTDWQVLAGTVNGLREQVRQLQDTADRARDQALGGFEPVGNNVGRPN
jgi:hypothetical protein